MNVQINKSQSHRVTSQNLEILSQREDVKHMLSVQMCILLWICLLKCKSLHIQHCLPKLFQSSRLLMVYWVGLKHNLTWGFVVLLFGFFCAYPIIIDIIINRFPSTELLLNYTKVEKYFYTAWDAEASCLMKRTVSSLFFFFFYHTSTIMFEFCLWVYCFSF